MTHESRKLGACPDSPQHVDLMWVMPIPEIETEKGDWGPHDVHHHNVNVIGQLMNGVRWMLLGPMTQVLFHSIL